jgi:hypothetical protein
MLDAIGYILIFGLFFGFPLYFVGYGAWVAAKRGVKGQPEDRPVSSVSEEQEKRSRKDQRVA